MLIIKSPHQPHQMTARRQHHQHMKNLMTTPKKIKSTGCQAFRETRGVDASAEDVQEALQEDPVETNGVAERGEGVDGGRVEDREDGGEAHYL